jgi:hypothetical protein
MESHGGEIAPEAQEAAGQKTGKKTGVGAHGAPVR